MPGRCGVWRNAGAAATVTKMDGVLLENATPRLAYQLAVPAADSTATVVYKIHGDGVIEVAATLKPAGKLPEIPRVGMQCQLAEANPTWSWFGRGPGENDRDRKAGCPVGIWQGKVADLWFPYVRPQETANRTDVRWSTFTGASGKGLRFEAVAVVAGGRLLDDGAGADDGWVIARARARRASWRPISGFLRGSGSSRKCGLTCGQVAEKLRHP